MPTSDRDLQEGSGHASLQTCGIVSHASFKSCNTDPPAKELEAARFMNPHTEPSSDRTDFQATNAGSTLVMADDWPEAKVRYRIAFGVTLNGLHVEAEWLPMLQRLKSAPLSLEELKAGGAKNRVSPQRILNALYLQSGLMISRAFDTKVK